VFLTLIALINPFLSISYATGHLSHSTLEFAQSLNLKHPLLLDHPRGGSAEDKGPQKVAKTNHNKPSADGQTDRQTQHAGSQEGL